MEMKNRIKYLKFIYKKFLERQFSEKIGHLIEDEGYYISPKIARNVLPFLSKMRECKSPVEC